MCKLISLSAFLFIAAIFSCSVDNSFAQGPALSCSDASSMNLNSSNVVGTWYEVERYPKVASGVSCVTVDVNLSNATTLSVNTTYSNTPNSYVMTQTSSLQLNLTSNYTDGYNASYGFNGATPVATTFKLLNITTSNSVKYAYICGYTNANDNSTDFGIMLASQRVSNITQLNVALGLAGNYSIFQNITNFGNVTQSDSCVINGAQTTLPLAGALISLIYFLLKLA